MKKDEPEKCPLCGGDFYKVIYFGFPMKMCKDEECGCGWGFWAWIPGIYYTGYCMSYTGPYLKALWFWLFHIPEEE